MMDVKALAKGWADGGWDGADARRHLAGVLEEGPPFQLRARDRHALAFLIAEDAVSDSASVPPVLASDPRCKCSFDEVCGFCLDVAVERATNDDGGHVDVEDGTVTKLEDGEQFDEDCQMAFVGTPCGWGWLRVSDLVKAEP